jgi:hypothetical protein
VDTHGLQHPHVFHLQCALVKSFNEQTVLLQVRMPCLTPLAAVLQVQVVDLHVLVNGEQMRVRVFVQVVAQFRIVPTNKWGLPGPRVKSGKIHQQEYSRKAWSNFSDM